MIPKQYSQSTTTTKCEIFRSEDFNGATEALHQKDSHYDHFTKKFFEIVQKQKFFNRLPVIELVGIKHVLVSSILLHLMVLHSKREPCHSRRFGNFFFIFTSCAITGNTAKIPSCHCNMLCKNYASRKHIFWRKFKMLFIRKNSNFLFFISVLYKIY